MKKIDHAWFTYEEQTVFKYSYFKSSLSRISVYFLLMGTFISIKDICRTKVVNLLNNRYVSW